MEQPRIAVILNIPIEKLAEMCKGPEVLAEVLTITMNKGIQIGQAQILKDYNQMFWLHSERTIGNQERRDT